MGKFGGSRSLEGRHLHAHRVDSVKDIADRAVLAAGVHGLQDHEQTVTVIGPERLLKPFQPTVELVVAFLSASCLLPANSERSAGSQSAQVDPGPFLDPVPVQASASFQIFPAR